MAYTDEQIAADVARLEPIVGKTHAEWYAEACRVTPDDPDTTHKEVLWACRTRMALYVLGRDMGALADAAEKLAQACVDAGWKKETIEVENVRRALWWKEWVCG